MNPYNRISLYSQIIPLFFFFFSFLFITENALAARCLYVSSYHAGYTWNDNIEKAMATVLQDQCVIKKLYMDGKRNRNPEFAQKKALEAKALIDTWKPDIIIAADDNASKYLVMPYLKDVDVPVVFCGINWTADHYGYPYTNATGMIEVGPIEPLVEEVTRTVKNVKHGAFLSADEITQHKEVEHHKKVFKKYGIEVSHTVATTMAEWEKNYLELQKKADFLIIGNNAGINDWDNNRALTFTMEHSKIFSVAYLAWMSPYAMLTMARIAEEQGEWAGKAALAILQGSPPKSIPIIANRRWNMFINPSLLDKAGIHLSPDIMRKAVKVGQ